MELLEINNGGLVYMQAPHFGGEVRHAFTTRWGGVSRDIFASLNLGLERGDECRNVERNYDIICSELGTSPSELVFASQVHGDCVRKVTCADRKANLFSSTGYSADGLITNEPGLPLIVFSADCIPVLLCCEKPAAVAAVHAGWRGTAAGIVAKAADAMRDEFGCAPENIKAAIGPGIDSCCFETDGDVPEAMRKLKKIDPEPYIKVSGVKNKIDLKGINCALLVSAGLFRENICVSGECTMCLNDKYWSNRATGGNRGAQAAIIFLTTD